MEEHSEPCTQLQLTTQRVNGLEERADKQEKTNADIYTIIQDIRDRLLGRPSWAITFILAGLSSLCVGLLVRLATL